MENIVANRVTPNLILPFNTLSVLKITLSKNIITALKTKPIIIGDVAVIILIN